MRHRKKSRQINKHKKNRQTYKRKRIKTYIYLPDLVWLIYRFPAICLVIIVNQVYGGKKFENCIAEWQVNLQKDMIQKLYTFLTNWPFSFTSRTATWDSGSDTTWPTKNCPLGKYVSLFSSPSAVLLSTDSPLPPMTSSLGSNSSSMWSFPNARRLILLWDEWELRLLLWWTTCITS